jgi:hypothetical protein
VSDLRPDSGRRRISEAIERLDAGDVAGARERLVMLLIVE